MAASVPCRLKIGIYVYFRIRYEINVLQVKPFMENFHGRAAPVILKHYIVSDAYPCDKGYYSANGFHSDSDDCEECANG